MIKSSVVKIAGLEMFGLTKNLPKYRENFVVTNTFKYEFDEQCPLIK